MSVTTITTNLQSLPAIIRVDQTARENELKGEPMSIHSILRPSRGRSYVIRLCVVAGLALALAACSPQGPNQPQASSALPQLAAGPSGEAPSLPFDPQQLQALAESLSSLATQATVGVEQANELKSLLTELIGSGSPSAQSSDLGSAVEELRTAIEERVPESNGGEVDIQSEIDTLLAEAERMVMMSQMPGAVVVTPGPLGPGGPTPGPTPAPGPAPVPGPAPGPGPGPRPGPGPG